MRRLTRGEGYEADDWFKWQEPLLPGVDVPNTLSTKTGLLDRHGHPIWRAPRNMGFGRSLEQRRYYVDNQF